MTEPTEQELRGAKFLVEQIDACGDNTDKKIRLVAMIMHSINDELDDHKQLEQMLHERSKRKKVNNERSRSRMDKTSLYESGKPGSNPGGITKHRSFADQFKGIPGVTVKKY